MNILVVFNSGYQQIDSVRHDSVYHKIDEAGTLNIYKATGRLVASYAHKIWRMVYEV